MTSQTCSSLHGSDECLTDARTFARPKPAVPTFHYGNTRLADREPVNLPAGNLITVDSKLSGAAVILDHEAQRLSPQDIDSAVNEFEQVVEISTCQVSVDRGNQDRVTIAYTPILHVVNGESAPTDARYNTLDGARRMPH